jgi:Zn-dependent peptidase ImmA (M78 family)
MADTFGICDADEHIIYISTHLANRPTTETEQISTFIHEVGHAVLHTMGMDDNEQFVIAAEELVLQIILTMRYPTKRTTTPKK